MHNQHEIKTRQPLLNKQGGLSERGYTKGILMDYDRSMIKANALRIKEWDYYLVTTKDFAVALTIADNSYMGLDSISLMDFRLPWDHTNSPMAPLTLGNKNLPSSSARGSVSVGNKKYFIGFTHNGDHRRLNFLMKNFYDGKDIEGEIRLENPNQESIVIATPFSEKETHFYYNQKINCLKASGTVRYGEEKYDFNRPDAYGVLDWGRGVWTYSNTWYWGSASGEIDGVPFGFNIGYGFGDTSAASENMIFYKGKGHKIDQVNFNIPTKDGKEDYMSPWTFTSNDGRFEMDFRPILDRASCTDAKIICSDQHQVFGYFSGKAVLDDGSKIKVSDFLGFAEKVFNKW